MSNHIKYRQLKAFTLAVETGSFRAAAERLSVTQPSFSALIKNLESDLNVRLFDRTTRKCVVTHAGRLFYGQVSGSIAQLEDAYGFMMDVGGGERGRLTIAALPSLSSGVVTKGLAAFQKRYPRVRISLSEGKNNEIVEAVRRGDVELGIAALLAPDRDLVFEPCLTDRLMYVVPEGHPLQHGRATWKSAEKLDVILMSGGPVEQALRMSGARVQPAFEIDQTITAIAMVRHGMGITIMPSSILPTLNLEGLVCLPIQGPLATRQLGAIYRSEVRLPAAARAFVQVLNEISAT